MIDLNKDWDPSSSRRRVVAEGILVCARASEARSGPLSSGRDQHGPTVRARLAAQTWVGSLELVQGCHREEMSE